MHEAHVRSQAGHILPRAMHAQVMLQCKGLDLPPLSSTTPVGGCPTGAATFDGTTWRVFCLGCDRIGFLPRSPPAFADTFASFHCGWGQGDPVLHFVRWLFPLQGPPQGNSLLVEGEVLNGNDPRE